MIRWENFCLSMNINVPFPLVLCAVCIRTYVLYGTDGLDPFAFSVDLHLAKVQVTVVSIAPCPEVDTYGRILLAMLKQCLPFTQVRHLVQLTRDTLPWISQSTPMRHRRIYA